MNTDKELAILCDNIKLLRKRHHFTQKEMAQKLGISINSLRSIEKGVFPPRVSCKIFYRIYENFYIIPSKIIEPLE